VKLIIITLLHYHFIALLSHLFKPVIIYNGSEVTSDFSSLYKETEEGLRFQKSIHASDIVIRSSTRLLAILDGITYLLFLGTFKNT